MDNVLEFPKPTPKSQKTEDPIVKFITHSLIPWAEENNVDTSSMQFKINGATIMTCLQGMLLKDDI
jgi:hypothetical protein